MAYKALYRKYRPTDFDAIVGQQHIVQTLENAIKQDKVSHAYLFCGSRGTGKTTIAKIFARKINGLPEDYDETQTTDIIEMDAASNNGVDEIREMIESVKYPPIQLKYKVFIIDEVHMLSKGAFNALLKTLEEPPSYVVFIMATTEIQKVLSTIVSRCQRYDFLRVQPEDIVCKLKEICDKESIKITDDALMLIAQISNGGMRDALSMLDQCSVYTDKNIVSDNVKELYGLTTTEDKIQLLEYIAAHNVTEILKMLQTMQKHSVDFKRLNQDILSILKEILMFAYTQAQVPLQIISEEQCGKLLECFEIDEILEMIDILIENAQVYYQSIDLYAHFEITCLKLIHVMQKQEQAKVTVPKKEDIQETVIVESKAIENSKEPIIKEEPVAEEKAIDTTEEIAESEVVQPLFEALDNPIIEDEMFLIGLLVQCDKNTKLNDLKVYQRIGEYTIDLEYGRYANLLKKTTLVASGVDCMIIKSDDDSIVELLNEPKMNKGCYFFIKDALHLDKMIYAITSEQEVKLIDTFKNLHKNNQLPAPSVIQRHAISNEKEVDNGLQNLYDVFGEDTVEVL